MVHCGPEGVVKNRQVRSDGHDQNTSAGKPMRRHMSHSHAIGMHTTAPDATALPTMMEPEPEAAPSGSESECTPTSYESDSDDFESRVEAYILGKEEDSFARGYEEAQSRCRLAMLCKAMVRPPTYPLQARIVELAGEKSSLAMANRLRSLPPEVLKNIRGYASDRVHPHPTAALIKDSVFNRDVLGEHAPLGDGYPALYVFHPFITKRVRKCSDSTCLTCMIGNWSCRNSRLVTRPVGRRRYITSDFCEPDRYMEDYRPKTVVGTDGNVRPMRTAWGLASEEHAFAWMLGDNFPYYHIL